MKCREIIKKSLLELHQELDTWIDPTWESATDGAGCSHDLPEIAYGYYQTHKHFQVHCANLNIS